MKNEELDLEVALTTTEYSFVSEDGDNQKEIDLILQNIPVCISQMSFEAPYPGLDLKKEIDWTLLRSVGRVEINSNLRSVFIGVDPEIEETGIVIYQDLRPDPRIDAFFKRWDETHTLIFEYTMNRIKPARVFTCIRGVRIGNAWVKLDIVAKPSLTICDKI